MRLRRLLAFAFAATLTCFSAVWMYYIRAERSAPTLGLQLEYQPSEAAARVREAQPGSPAAKAGIRPGDHVVAVDGMPLTSITVMHGIVAGRAPGDPVTIRVRPGDAGATRELSLALVARGALQSPERPGPAEPGGTTPSFAAGLVLNALLLYPLPFLIVSVGVLLQRPDDVNAWAMAVTFAGFIAGAPVLPLEPLLPVPLRGFVIGFATTLAVLMPGVLYFFLAVFPAPSPIDRWVPWLKHVFVGFGALVALPLGVACFLANDSGPIWWLLERTRDWPRTPIILGYNLGGVVLALASLTANSFGAAAETRRKTRVILAGTIAAILPLVLLNIWIAAAGKPPSEVVPFWAWAAAVLALSLLPGSVAYAVVKHRVLELPVLLQRSARYLLVRRGALTLAALAGIGATLLFAAVFRKLFGHTAQFTQSGGLVAGSLFGGVLAIAGQRLLRPAEERIDRAFFRGAYDARRILERVAADSRAATDRNELARQIEGSLEEALQPRALYVYLRDESDQRYLVAMGADREALAAVRLPADAPGWADLARRAQPLVLAPEDLDAGGAFADCRQLTPEMVVPMVGRAGRLEGLIVLGPRLSEEPYSGEDRALLASAAAQAALALENIQLAESMAARIETERRQARELEIAKQVQAKLLPQAVPPMATLEYAGRCIQAREVGGDYYDFVALEGGQLAIVLADISGKGMSAALLMASLQATLRAQYTRARGDLQGLLRSVNRLFFESTATNHYATLFFGVYDEQTRRMHYANCGHLPPIVRRASGAVDRLGTTGAVVGLFEQWDCSTADVALESGDLLVIFSDGVTEAMDAAGDEYGEARLTALVERVHAEPVDTLIAQVVEAVSSHSGPAQFDDLTLIAARVR